MLIKEKAFGKLKKVFVDRRVNLLVEEGLIIKTNVEVGKDLSAEELLSDYDAICLAVGALNFFHDNII